VPPTDSILLDLPGFTIVEVIGVNRLTLRVDYDRQLARCPHCRSNRLRIKDSFLRRIRHVLFGQRPSWLEVKAHKFHCRNCGRYFNSRFPGIRPRKRASEPCRVEVSNLHHNGWTQRSLCQHIRCGSATVERLYQEQFKIKNQELKNAQCPRVLGIDEHFFTRKEGYATTLANLTSQKVFDVVLGRSEPSLRAYLRKLTGKDRVRVVVMDLSETYRSIAKKYFPNALVVADRFHVIRLVNHHFVKTWGELDEKGRKHRGLLSLMRRHPDNFKPGQKERLYAYLNEVPGLRPMYDFWQDLLRLLRMKGCNQRHCRQLVPEFLWIIDELKRTKFQHLQSLGCTLENWKEEIARMFRFSKTNGITEGLHNKMEMLSRRAFGFRNFENYRLRVRIVCG
jgi:transposase